MQIAISSPAEQRRGLSAVGGSRLSGSLYHPLFSEQLQYESQVVPDDSDGQVMGTIQLMARYAREDSRSQGVQADVRAILNRCEAGARDEDLVCGVWKLVQGRIKFVRDEVVAGPIEAFMSQTYLKPEFPMPIVEILVRPRDMAVMGRRLGDCDDYAMYAASLLVGLGIPCSFVTLAGDREAPREFSHVYVAAYPGGEQGRRIAVDASHGRYCGWEGTKMRLGARMQEWPVQGDTVGEFMACRVGMVMVLAATVGGFLWAVSK